MKRMDEWINELYPDELAKVKPEPTDEEAILKMTLEKLEIAPETEEVREQSRKRRKNLWVKMTAVGAAACVAVLLAVNTAFPAFAENLPGVGVLFRIINQHNSEDFYNAENLSSVQARMAPVTDAVSYTREGDLKFTVKEAFYDGLTLYCAAELQTELDPNAGQTDWEYQIYINGKKLDFNYANFWRNWVKSGENTYVNDSMSTKIPAEFRPEQPGDLRVKVEAAFWDMSHTEEKVDGDAKVISQMLGEAVTEFTARYDPSSTVEIAGEAEQNGVKFISLVSTPASTSICVDVPREMAGYYGDRTASVGLYLENGKKVELNSGETRDSDTSPLYVRETNSGEGIPEGETKVIARVDSFDAAGQKEVLAEFVIDLEQKTVMPRE